MKISASLNVLASLAVLAAAVAVTWAGADNGRDLTRLTLPDDDVAAAQSLHKWLTDRGFECELRTNLVLLRRGGVLMNLIPLTQREGLDRLRVVSFYFPEDEYRGTDELTAAVYDRNQAQNLCQVFLDEDGDFAVGSNLTFYDEFTAREFDAFLELFAAVVKRHVLTEETVKLLK